MPKVYAPNFKHGLCETRLYSIWTNMKSRCNNPNHPDYHNYGGRGVQVCKEWEDNFYCFYQWAMSNGYADSLTIDREDNDGNYCPENCRWVSKVIQANNKRNNPMFEYKGDTHTLKEWSRILSIPYMTLRKRILSLNWSISKAFETPVRPFNVVKEAQ